LVLGNWYYPHEEKGLISPKFKIFYKV